MDPDEDKVMLAVGRCDPVSPVYWSLGLWSDEIAACELSNYSALIHGQVQTSKFYNKQHRLL